MCYNAAMERRKSRRVRFSLKAERISGSGDRTVFIENISEDGILIVLPHAKKSGKFKPGIKVDLNLKLNTGKKIALDCTVRWVFEKTPPDGLTDSIGLEIARPPVSYRKFVQSVYQTLNVPTDPAS